MMIKETYFLSQIICYLIISFAVTTSSIDPPVGAPAPTVMTSPIWNHVMVVTYGVNYCKAYPCSGSPITFEKLTIHGLWPNSKPSKVLVPTATLMNCDPSSVLAKGDVMTLQKDLDQSWPSLSGYLVSNKNFMFWSHEWSVHGTCTNFNKPDYFAKTLGLYHKINPTFLLSILKPDMTHGYFVNDVIAAHTNLGLPKPYIACKNYAGKSLLTELYYCFDANIQAKNCTDYYQFHSNCPLPPKTFYILPA